MAKKFRTITQIDDNAYIRVEDPKLGIVYIKWSDLKAQLNE